MQSGSKLEFDTMSIVVSKRVLLGVRALYDGVIVECQFEALLALGSTFSKYLVTDN